ncbi:MAG: glutamate-1-semialdehyde 2,1-aminomutase [candidate division Zixibacteria bacterium]|nr:glutamate-1-semialdehyde 2,1-aminomutase [candidate division Zixibacteria bacterium]
MHKSKNAGLNHSQSREVFAQSCDVIPGGVNSPVRAFKSVGGSPFIAKKGSGPWLSDIDGNRYVDYVMSWGPLILGHAPAVVVDAVQKAAANGTSFGAPTRTELTLASLIRDRMPWIERLRLVSSGTEACMTAARIARGATGRQLVVKFDGGYHGHSDFFLVKAGSGLATGGLPASAGVPSDISKTTLSLPYNDISALEHLFAQNGSSIAAVIVEPVAANMGVVPPGDGFLEAIRKLTSEHGSVMILDEVITGFRVAPGGAAQLYGITPDLVCLGKIVGGGLPVGAVGGKRDLMEQLAPLGAVYQAGTLSGNPLSTAAGVATLQALGDTGIYRHLRQYADDLIGQIRDRAAKHGRDITINQVESLFTLFFGSEPVTDFASAQRADHEFYGRFFHHLLEHHVFVAPSGYEAWFVSGAHGSEQLDITVNAVHNCFRDCASD